MPSPTIDELNNEINRLRAQLGKGALAIDFTSINAAKKEIKALMGELSEMDTELYAINDQFNKMVYSLTSQTTIITNIKNTYKSLSSISEKLSSVRKGELDLTKKQLEELQRKAKLEYEHVEKIKSSVIEEIRNGVLNQTLSKKEIASLNEKLKYLKEIESTHSTYMSDVQNVIDLQDKINNNSAVKGFGFLEDISKSIPGLRTLSEPFQKASAASKEAVRYNESILNTGEKAKNVFGAGAKELLSSFKGAAVWAIIIKQLWDAFIKTDKLAGDMAKSMNMTYSASLSTVTSLTSMANISGDNFVTTQKLGETLMHINKTLGTSVMLSKEQLVIFTQLREKAGLTNEELMGMSALSLATNQDFESITEQFLGQARITASNNKVLLNSKDLFRSIKDISAATTLSLGQSSGKLAEALATTKAMGLEMSKIENIQETLMDFESSIENQLSAELLIGRQINLERARGYALNNDIKGLTEEIAKLSGTAVDFGNMNLIQQNNFAKSLGLSREELAKSLYIRNQLLNVSAKDQALAERVINAKIKEVGLDQAQKELGEKSLQDMMDQVSVQDRFNASVEKLKEVFVNIVEILMPFIDGITEATKGIGYIMKGVSDFKNESSGFRQNFKQENPIWNTILFGGEHYNSQGQKINIVGDVISPASGRTTISTKEGGLLKLSPNDDVIAAPGAAKLLNKQSSYAVDMSETNNLLRQLVYKQGTIKIDNTEIGTAFTVNSYNIQ